MPIHFSDEQLDTLFRLARPLPPQCRVVFMEILAREFSGRDGVGDGELYRVARDIIKANHLFEAPTFEGRWSKHR